ncbi:hypothetical protein CW712_04830 [Candidatus Bathyarchaeota archaeon]|nr:MAG: hypothetical protein CW712_04830 [Candidatus Bathyarchaeota archaeon]
MFKLGVITDEISQNVEKAVEVSTQLGLDCIELRGCWNKNIKDLTDLGVRRIKQLAASASLEVVCLASPFFKCHITNQTEVQEHSFLKSIFLAEEALRHRSSLFML